MSALVQRGQALATRLLTKEAMGVVVLVSPGAPTGPDYDPQPGAPIERPINAVVLPVGVDRINGTSILSGDSFAKCPVFPDLHEPKVGEVVRVDGQDRQIVRVKRTPDAGPVIVWELQLRT